tara:strand:+ start:61 stop:276 length:216 start_codon:yes stop_codon:yes gene_type:complete
MSYHQFIDEETKEPYGSFEVFYYSDSTGLPTRIGPKGFYWWSCFPGCMPDNTDPSGPFKTHHEALEDALTC